MREAGRVVAGRGRGNTALTLAELLAVVVVVVLAGLLLLAGSSAAFSGGMLDAARSARCRAGMRQAYLGLRMYLNNNEEYFPPAWHVGGKRAAEDLGNLAFHRFLILEYCDTQFRRVVGQADVARHQGDRQAAAQEKFKQSAAFWRCPASGWTDDYFAPEIVFRIPEKPGEPFDKNPQYAELVKDVAPTERPLLADVNASLPNPKASDPADPGHEKEMREGFSTVKGPGVDVFVGVGASLRDPKTARFDFRHASEGGPQANLLFLDGHIASLGARNPARLERLHSRWNHLAPPAQE